MFTAYCAVSVFPSARNRDRRQDRVRVRDHQDRLDATDPDRIPVRQDAMGHVHARVQEIRDRDIPDKTEGKDRSDNKVDSMDKDRTDIRGRAQEYPGLFGIAGLFLDDDSSHAPLSIR
ncbi:hypothetical protein AK95_18895 [Paenibacillus sp. LC231]|uniref:hypothetical protein n=1 Tax=Paenibacillus sp. LC231 TaxID=1120679 RepID=UPI0008DDFA64|nr:hypothetical protein [Paenibacillus sp. LC231]OIA99243.1 hypothetical protein AK95_18895 [Paenibacillus sp. LC231]